MAQIRLDKLLAQSGERSRSEAAKLIRAGRVSVDGVVTNNPADKADTEKSSVSLDGQEILNAPFQYVMLHKPAGVLTAARDHRGATVMSLLPEAMHTRQVMPVGRLDKDTTGLLLFTNDGRLAHRLLSPRNHVWKEYRATVDGLLTQDHCTVFERGVVLSDFTALPAKLVIESAGDAESVCTVRIREGKYHQVKRMFLAQGLHVTALHRQAFGPVTLDIEPGEYRALRGAEIEALYQDAATDGEERHG